jgi:hypothetical protein
MSTSLPGNSSSFLQSGSEFGRSIDEERTLLWCRLRFSAEFFDAPDFLENGLRDLPGTAPALLSA